MTRWPRLPPTSSKPGRACPSTRSTIAARKSDPASLPESRAFSVLERTWARPTMDVHGMPGGFTGAGAKTVIPAKATAKISFRLVPDMNPQEAFAQYKSYVESLQPKGIELRVRLIHSGDPIVVRTDNPLHPGGDSCPAPGIRERDGLYPLRRLHSHRGRFRASPQNPHRHDGLWPDRTTTCMPRMRNFTSPTFTGVSSRSFSSSKSSGKRVGDT